MSTAATLRENATAAFPGVLLDAVKLVDNLASSPFRCRPLGETLNTAMGAINCAGISRLADITGLDNISVPVWSAIRPNALSLSVSSGKGVTPGAALVSAVIEALELFHAENFTDCTTYRELGREVAFPDVRTLPCVQRALQRSALPSPDLQVSLGVDVASGQPTAVPFDLVHARLRPNWHRGGSGFLISTNGLGAGNEYHEAVLHGLCEVVERDAIALLSACDPERRMADKRRLDWTTVSDPISLQLLDRCLAQGIQPLVFDITSDIDIPTFYCRLSACAESAADVGAADGAGCHPNSAIALQRAVLESIQTRLLLISGSRDDIRASYYLVDPSSPRGSQPTSAFEARNGYSGPAGAAVVKWALSRLACRGYSEVIAIDLGSCVEGLSFLRIVIPGLEGSTHSKHYTPGQRALRAGRRT